MSSQDNVYTHGHHESVLLSHKWRTVENSAKYLVPFLKDGSLLLDAGCGPGNISAGLAELIPNGKVIGIDFSTDIIEQAQQGYPTLKYENLEFEQGDIYNLKFADDSFDVIHMHQVLQHLKNPVSALIELRRVLKPGGILACRDADYGAFTWCPELPQLERWRALYRDITQRNQAESNGGRFLKTWTMEADLDLIEIGCSTWVFSNDRDRQWWGNMWSKRVIQSDFADQAIAYGFSDQQELEEISSAFLEWANDPTGFYAVPHTEVIATKRLLDGIK